MTTFRAAHRLLTAALMAVFALVVSIASALAPLTRSPWFRPVASAVCCVLAVLLYPESWLMAPIVIGSTLTETAHDGEFLIVEQPGRLSRDQVTVTVPASTTLRSGYVLGKVTATGKYVPYDNAASDGREVAAGVLWAALVNDEVTAADKTGVVINFGAEVRQGDLIWLDEANDETAGLADLRALFVKAR